MIYLDNAATTLKKPEKVKETMFKAFDSCANAGRGGYNEAMNAAEYVFGAREKVAELFGVSNVEQVTFTLNATHALNIAINAFAFHGHCVISGYEHNSVLRPINYFAKKGLSYSVANGRLFDEADMVKKFKLAFRKNTRFAVCTHVSNVFGYILPIKEIDLLCYEKGIPLIIDASQSAGSVELNMSDLKATVCVCAPGHKGLYGPQGTGVLVCKNGELLKPLLYGGTGSVSRQAEQPDFMPDRHESGTQNAIGIAGLFEGVSYVLEKGAGNILEKEKMLIGYVAKELAKISGIKVFAAKEKRVQSGVLSFVCDSCGPDYIAERLAEKRVAVRGGFHCSPLAHKSVGTTNGSVRVSVSDFTDVSEIESFIETLRRILGER